MSKATLQIEKKKTLVPQLRFQEFDGEWKLKNLEEISSWASGGTPPKDNPLFWDGDIPWISASSMRGIVYSDSELKITNAGLKKGSKLARKGSLLILVRGSMLFNKIPIGIVSKDVSFNQDVKSIVVDGNYSTSEFILNWFTAFEPKILNMVTGTGIGAGKLDQPDLKALKISLPTLPEQQKIASFLSAVDEKIQQLSRKKELLSQYKKGVMQQLFSGKLRFKDENGEDYADWEEKTFGDIFSFYTTNSLSRENLNYNDGEVKNIHYGDIHTKFKTLFDINNELVPFINADFIVSKIKKECYCQEGDLVIADASEDYADIGKSIEIINIQNEKIVAGLHTFLARPNKTKMYVGFSGYIVRSDNFRKQIMTIAQGSKVLSISTGRLAMVKMKIPSIKEQQKIANFLSSIDAKIENTGQEIAQTQGFKKGLLQQMFV